ncbi:MAG: enoyl-CoA hydratase/isomerase family protein [Solirubrobacteraceae bacterium]
MSEPVTLEREGDLAVVTFDSPPLNLFDDALSAGLTEAVGELERSAPRAVLFRAQGRVVSAGVDVKVFAALKDAEEARGLFDGLVDVARRVDHLPCPTVFSAHGLCLTWAFELALACDILIASTSAQFGLVESRVGLTPAMGGTQRLAERAGTGRAREFVMTGDLYDAATMERWNVVNRVVSDEEIGDAARALAERLAVGPTPAHAATKELLRSYLEGGVERANNDIGRIAGDLWNTDDLHTGVASFLADGPGKARFSGR